MGRFLFGILFLSNTLFVLRDGVQSLRAGDKLLKGASLTADDLYILRKAGYFDDVARIEKARRAKEINIHGGKK